MMGTLNQNHYESLELEKNDSREFAIHNYKRNSNEMLRVHLGNIENQEITQHRMPKFQSTFKPVPKVNFELSSIKPGLPSEKLCEALGMKSNKEAPPYFSSLKRIKLPYYCKSNVCY